MLRAPLAGDWPPLTSTGPATSRDKPLLRHGGNKLFHQVVRGPSRSRPPRSASTQACQGGTRTVFSVRQIRASATEPFVESARGCREGLRRPQRAVAIRERRPGMPDGQAQRPLETRKTTFQSGRRPLEGHSFCQPSTGNHMPSPRALIHSFQAWGQRQDACRGTRSGCEMWQGFNQSP